PREQHDGRGHVNFPGTGIRGWQVADDPAGVQQVRSTHGPASGPLSRQRRSSSSFSYSAHSADSFKAPAVARVGSFPGAGPGDEELTVISTSLPSSSSSGSNGSSRPEW